MWSGRDDDCENKRFARESFDWSAGSFGLAGSVRNKFSDCFALLCAIWNMFLSFTLSCFFR